MLLVYRVVGFSYTYNFIAASRIGVVESIQTRASEIAYKNVAVVEWRLTGHTSLKNFPAFLGVWVVFRGQTNCLKLGYVYSLLTATQGLSLIAHYSPTLLQLTILNILSIRFCQPRGVLLI